MGYSERQVQSMHAMGLVPWVRRDQPIATSAVSLAEPPTGNLVLSLDTPLMEIGQAGVYSAGSKDAELLLIFGPEGTKPGWPLDRPDDALLDGMLRAIGLAKSSVCCCALTPEPNDAAETLRSVLMSPRKYFLYFDAEPLAENVTEPQAIVLNEQSAGWQLPTLARLRAEPQRKRHAWITLKQLRSSLDHR